MFYFLQDSLLRSSIFNSIFSSTLMCMFSFHMTDFFSIFNPIILFYGIFFFGWAAFVLSIYMCMGVFTGKLEP